MSGGTEIFGPSRVRVQSMPIVQRDEFSVAVRVDEPTGLDRQGQPVCTGIAVPAGIWFDPDSLELASGVDGPVLRSQHRVAARWTDGSIKWLFLEFLADVAGGSSTSYRLRETQGQADSQASITASPPFRFSAALSSQRLELIDMQGEPSNLPIRACLVDSRDQTHEVRFAEPVKCASSGQVRRSYTAEGTVDSGDGRELQCFLRIDTFVASDMVRMSLRLANSHAARHLGGLWDLGDEGSVRFRGFQLSINAESFSRPSVSLGPAAPVVDVARAEAVRVVQHSSAGENWRSTVHVNRDREVPLRIRGYTVSTDDLEQHFEGRAVPIVSSRIGTSSIGASVAGFWETFPTAIALTGRSLVIEPFPTDWCDLHELQGGESSSTTIQIVLSEEPAARLAALREPLVPVVDAESWQRADVVPYFHAGESGSLLDELVRLAPAGPDQFMEKRELVDEYGWRNFGDVFADHESLYREADAPLLISHYNNQYDLLYGFLVQFMKTGDRRWFRLADELAAHAVDIDLYQTTGDRVEFSGGMFWHTMHYLDAGTSTHRTWSSEQPGVSGGGPGAQHCYTTGLAYHYFLTGSERSRSAVLQLANWMVDTETGGEGLLAKLQTIARGEVPRIRAALSGKPGPSARFALSRGSGNFVRAMLDANAVSQEAHWLERAGQIIAQTVHPSDDIALRGLDDIEETWSYTVFLQAIGDYLHAKEHAKQIDDDYHYAKAALLHYLAWMLNHELPYFSRKEKLEFVNDTWPAQEIRKCTLMFLGARYDHASRERYLESARHYLQVLESELSSSSTANHTRVQAILLQSYSLADALHLNRTDPYGQSPAEHTYGPMPVDAVGPLAKSVAHRLIRGLAEFSPSREKAWIRSKLDSRG